MRYVFNLISSWLFTSISFSCCYYSLVQLTAQGCLQVNKRDDAGVPSILRELVMGFWQWHILLQCWPLKAYQWGATQTECVTWKGVHKSHCLQHMFLHTSTPHSVKMLQTHSDFPCTHLNSVTGHLLLLCLQLLVQPSSAEMKINQTFFDQTSQKDNNEDGCGIYFKKKKKLQTSFKLAS